MSEITMKILLSDIGLFFDIVGAVLIFIYGTKTPSIIDGGGADTIYKKSTENTGSYFGIFFLVIGFIFQISYAQKIIINIFM